MPAIFDSMYYYIHEDTTKKAKKTEVKQKNTIINDSIKKDKVSKSNEKEEDEEMVVECFNVKPYVGSLKFQGAFAVSTVNYLNNSQCYQQITCATYITHCARVLK